MKLGLCTDKLFVTPYHYHPSLLDSCVYYSQSWSMRVYLCVKGSVTKEREQGVGYGRCAKNVK